MKGLVTIGVYGRKDLINSKFLFVFYKIGFVTIGAVDITAIKSNKDLRVSDPGTFSLITVKNIFYQHGGSIIHEGSRGAPPLGNIN